jgi:predicted esterase
MSVAELEKAVSILSPEELRQFRTWFADFDMAQWDRQIEQDSNAGKLDHLINKALEDHRAGRTTDL